MERKLCSAECNKVCGNVCCAKMCMLCAFMLHNFAQLCNNMRTVFPQNDVVQNVLYKALDLTRHDL